MTDVTTTVASLLVGQWYYVPAEWEEPDSLGRFYDGEWREVTEVTRCNLEGVDSVRIKSTDGEDAIWPADEVVLVTLEP